MPKNTNTLALAAAVAGAVGWTAMPFVGTIAAIVLGHMARAEIRKSGEEGDSPSSASRWATATSR